MQASSNLRLANAPTGHALLGIFPHPRNLTEPNTVFPMKNEAQLVSWLIQSPKAEKLAGSNRVDSLRATGFRLPGLLLRRQPHLCHPKSGPVPPAANSPAPQCHPRKSVNSKSHGPLIFCSPLQTATALAMAVVQYIRTRV